MKSKIKIIAFIMLCFVTFNSFSINTEKKANAFILESYLIYQAGVSFVAFTGFAGLMAVNGYHMQLADLGIAFANKYYDYANGVYTVKQDKINVVEKLNLAVSSFLSGNNPLTVDELQDIMNDIESEYPKRVDLADINYTTTFSSTFPASGSLEYYEGNIKLIKPEFANKIIKLYVDETNPEYYVYIDTTIRGWTSYGSYQFPNLSIIDMNGAVTTFMLNNNIIRHIGIDTLYKTSKVYDAINDYGVKNLLAIVSGKDNVTLNDDYGITKGTYSDYNFVGSPSIAFPNFYSALSGKSGTVDELIGLMNTDEYLQREIAALLKKQAVNQENDLLAPEVGTDGKLYYPDNSVPDVPDIPYTPTETWYNNLFGWLVGMPDKIAEKVADIPILGDIVGGITDLVGRVTDIWDWLRNGLLGILQSILNAILDILAFLVGLPALLIQLLKDALIWLFVPDATFFNGKLEEFKLNFAFIDTFTAFIQRLEDMTSSNAVPTVSVDLSKFKGSFGGQPISMGAEAYILDMRWYLPFKALGDLMFTAFVYVMFIWRFFGRLPEIISGGGLLYTADSKTDDLVRKLEGKKK